MAYCTFSSRLIEHIAIPAGMMLKGRFEDWKLEKDCDFKDSMPHCALCKFLYRSLEESFGEQSAILDREGKLRKICLFNSFGYRYRNGKLYRPLCRVVLDFPSIRGRSTTNPSLHGRSMTEFTVWAEPGKYHYFRRCTEGFTSREFTRITDRILGDPAAATITTQPPIHKDESEIDQICTLLRNRLYDCITTHPECGQTNTSGTEPRLPTRVLYVKNATSHHSSVKLVQTYGATGAYCALSHCWGPVDRLPIRTLKENIQDHYSGIPLTALPRTFREAAILTQGLGIDYLWIDSLCIQQDDADDWRREAASMGSLYQQATLVIAATGSKDPTGGIFICERSPKIAIQLPYAGKGGRNGGTFNLAVLSPSMQAFSSYLVPLQERAWALQESYLAQRMVVFTSRGMDWLCTTFKWDENGRYDDLGLYEYLSWFMLLKVYSETKLTWPSDRLVAFQGIVNEESKRRDDTFLSEGMWEKEIPQHLLWYQTSLLAPGDPTLPSWSWAATEGSKKWICDAAWDDKFQYDYSCVVTQRVQPAHLSVSGDLIETGVGWAETNICCADRFRGYFEERSGDILEFVQTHLLQPDKGVIGIAALDQNENSTISTDLNTLKFCVLSKVVKKGYNLKPSNMAKTSGISMPGNTGRRHLDSCVDLWQEPQNIEYVLLALVLEPVADNEETYKRAGLAMLLPSVRIAGLCKPACFTLK